MRFLLVVQMINYPNPRTAAPRRPARRYKRRFQSLGRCNISGSCRPIYKRSSQEHESAGGGNPRREDRRFEKYLGMIQLPDDRGGDPLAAGGRRARLRGPLSWIPGRRLFRLSL